MQVKDVMTKSLVVVSTDTPIQSVAELMAKDDVGALPVRKGAALEGMVTDRDIVIRALAKGLPFSTPAGDIMSTGLVLCKVDIFNFAEPIFSGCKAQRTQRILCDTVRPLERSSREKGALPFGNGPIRPFSARSPARRTAEGTPSPFFA